MGKALAERSDLSRYVYGGRRGAWRALSASFSKGPKTGSC